LFAGAPAFGDDWQRAPWGSGPYGGRNNGAWSNRAAGAVVDRAASDLRRVAAHAGYIDNGARRHVDHALTDLDRFEYDWSRNARFDRGRLDSAISNMDHVIRSNRIDPRDRGLLSRDLPELRNFRNNGPGPYGNRW